MQIILNQSEIEEAIKVDVLSKISIQEGFTVSVELDREGDEVTAYVTIVPEGEEDDTSTSGTKGSKPKTRRNKKTTTPAATVETKAEVTSDPDLVEETEKQEEDPPFVTDDKAAEVVTEIPSELKVDDKPADQNATSGKDEPEPAKPTNVTKIFPDVGSSAAATIPKEEPSPEVAAKSLFANLNKPTH